MAAMLNFSLLYGFGLCYVEKNDTFVFVGLLYGIVILDSMKNYVHNIVSFQVRKAGRCLAESGTLLDTHIASRVKVNSPN